VRFCGRVRPLLFTVFRPSDVYAWSKRAGQQTDQPCFARLIRLFQPSIFRLFMMKLTQTFMKIVLLSRTNITIT
jgi:hypothetical protein